MDLAPRAIADPLDRWTHHFTEEDTYGALDHMLVSPRLAAQNPAAGMEVIRAGSPYHAARYTGFRYPGIGWFEPKASDHCPLVASIKFEGQALNP